MTTEAYPLSWPAGWPRSARRRNAMFKLGTAQAKRALLKEVERLKGSRPIISTNLRLGADGFFNAAQAQPSDPGVAVYFTLKGKPTVLACDAWNRVQDNLIAILRTLEAMRAIERWGASDMMERAFAGFSALPPPVQAEHWTTVLQCQEIDDLEFIELSFRHLMKKAHPDLGGSHAAAQRLNKAIEEARAAKGMS